MSSQNLTFAGRPVAYNYTLWYNPSQLCTLDTCPKSYAVLQYIPSLGANAFFLSWFAVILVMQSVIGIQQRTWTYFSAMLGGAFLEVIGYAARVLMHNNIFNFNWFLMYLICLTIAPCFFSAAIYLNFSRLVLLHGPHLARFKPQTYTIIFIVWDIISLALQAAGGGLADTAADGGSGRTGINIMIAGLASQVASMAIFAVFCADFAWRARKSGRTINAAETQRCLATIGSSTRWCLALIIALIVAIVTILIRSCYRVAELNGGFGGHLANDEVTYVILEGVMVAIAALALTVVHPAFVFGRYWKLKFATEVFSSSQLAVADTTEVKVSHH